MNLSLGKYESNFVCPLKKLHNIYHHTAIYSIANKTGIHRLTCVALSWQDIHRLFKHSISSVNFEFPIMNPMVIATYLPQGS